MGSGTAIDMESFYWSCVASYVTVVIGLAVILWVNSHWCRVWFRWTCVSTSSK
ncbi:hypothetical protein [Serratia marcescens]|uniref:hypothetical protein n=1 Tax=Serratia marcescens TaxID=615 RepID=UPI0013D958FB|nr:hypothetical protein [Serratia marcescens]